MSYFSITDFIKSGQKSLDDKNYWSALSVALSLPSMCSRLQYENDNTYFKLNQDGTKHWYDKQCYLDFCKLCFSEDGWIRAILGDKFDEILYQLRCDMIHAGVANIYADNKGIYLSLGENATSTTFTNYRTIEVKALCESIFRHIDAWASNYGADNFKYTFVFDNENSRDDRLLYNRLCDKDRADLLEEQFIKENNERLGI